MASARVSGRAPKWGLLDDDVMAWHQSAPPDADLLRQLMDVRQIFEPKAAHWAAERGSDEAVDQIRSAIERMEEEKGSIEDFVIADAAFHRSVLHATGNEFLVALEGVIYSALLSSIRLTNADPRENESSLPLHRKVFEAIAERNGKKAEKAMDELLADANSRLHDRIDNV